MCLPMNIPVFCIVATRKAPINPPVPMKPLYWTRILVKTEKLEGSSALWDEIDELPLEALPEDFTKLFSRQVEGFIDAKNLFILINICR